MKRLFKGLAIALPLVVGGVNPALADVRIVDMQKGDSRDCLTADQVILAGRTIAKSIPRIPVTLIVLPRDGIRALSMVNEYSNRDFGQAMLATIAMGRVPVIISCGAGDTLANYIHMTREFFTDAKTIHWRRSPVPNSDASIWVPNRVGQEYLGW